MISFFKNAWNRYQLDQGKGDVETELRARMTKTKMDRMTALDEMDWAQCRADYHLRRERRIAECLSEYKREEVHYLNLKRAS